MDRIRSESLYKIPRRSRKEKIRNGHSRNLSKELQDFHDCDAVYSSFHSRTAVLNVLLGRPDGRLVERDQERNRYDLEIVPACVSIQGEAAL